MVAKTGGAGALVFIGLLAVGGCTPQDGEVRVDSDYGETLFIQKCSQCHGRDGKGAGPAASGLAVATPNLTALARQNRGQFPRDYVMSVIDGYDRGDGPDPVMPEFGADDLGPVIRVEEDHYVVSVRADLLALANYLETIQE